MYERETILVVDDEPYNLMVLTQMLNPHYEVHEVSDGAQAMEYLRSGGVADLILSDIMMPNMDGFELCRQLKVDSSFQEIPLLFLTSMDGADDEEAGLLMGAEDFIHKPFSPPSVIARVRSHLRLYRTTRQLREYNLNLEATVALRTQEVVRKAEEVIQQKAQVMRAQSATISAFCAMAETRDNETGNHIRRTQRYVKTLATALLHKECFASDLNAENIDLLYRSAPMHDIGKVGIPDRILLKPSALDDDEWIIMRRHAEYGRDAIDSVQSELTGESQFLRYAREIAYGHHERWDGGGYPQGLRGTAIPISARLMAIADAYDAIISKRVYKAATPHAEAVRLIGQDSGRHFDPDIVSVFLEIADSFLAISLNYSDAWSGQMDKPSPESTTIA